MRRPDRIADCMRRSCPPRNTEPRETLPRRSRIDSMGSISPRRWTRSTRPPPSTSCLALDVGRERQVPPFLLVPLPRRPSENREGWTASRRGDPCDRPPSIGLLYLHFCAVAALSIPVVANLTT